MVGGSYLMTWQSLEEGCAGGNLCADTSGKCRLQACVWCREHGDICCTLLFGNDFHLIGSVTIISHNTYVWRGDVSPALQVSRWQVFILKKSSETILPIKDIFFSMVLSLLKVTQISNFLKSFSRLLIEQNFSSFKLSWSFMQIFILECVLVICYCATKVKGQSFFILCKPVALHGIWT